MAAVGGWIHEVATPANLAKLTGVAEVVWQFVLPFIQKYKDELPELLPVALTIVKGLDAISDISNSDKLAQAVQQLSDFAKSRGFNVSGNVISAVIENALALFRISQQPAAAPPAPAPVVPLSQIPVQPNSEPSTFSLPKVPTDSIGGGDAAMEHQPPQVSGFTGQPPQSSGDVDANDK